MFLHLSVVDAFADEAFAVVDVDAFAEGLADAAWAMAVPPPTRAPESITAIAAFLIWCRMSLTSFPFAR